MWHFNISNRRKHLTSGLHPFPVDLDNCHSYKAEHSKTSYAYVYMAFFGNLSFSSPGLIIPPSYKWRAQSNVLWSNGTSQPNKTIETWKQYRAIVLSCWLMTLTKVDRCYGGCGVREEVLRWFLRTDKLAQQTSELAYCILPQRTTPAAPKAALSPMVLIRSLWKRRPNPHMRKTKIQK